MEDGPEWLEDFLRSDYFTSCPSHQNGEKRKKYFCVDCKQGALCHREISSHGKHQVLQVRKASRCKAIKTSDIEQLININGIQEYVINNRGIVFLDRPPSKRQNRAGCLVCGRKLIEHNNRFCCLVCKLKAVRETSRSNPLPPVSRPKFKLPDLNSLPPLDDEGKNS